MALSAGTHLGPYEVLGAIGAGGMGEVYQARDTRLKRTVAIKVLPPEMSSDPHRRGRLQREARTLASLSHPRICALFDVGEHDGSTFLVMELLQGETLAQRLERGPLPLPQALELAAQIAEGLDAAHKRGIVHRDLKPGNVMLTKTGAKVLDFGLAKLRAGGELDRNASTETDPLTGAGSVPGTLQYMAPEQLEGRVVDARADIWALGAILYEMVTGARPFQGTSSASLIAAILEHEPRPLAEALPLAPPSLGRVVRRCLERSPDDRWASARDLADELRWIAQDIAGGEPQTAQATPRPRWRRTAILAVAAIAVVLAAVAVLMTLRPIAGPASGPVVRSLLDVSPADEVRSAILSSSVTATPGGSRTAFAWTPDGRELVFAGRRGETQQLFMRSLDSDEARPLAGTEGAQAPAVSADGSWVACWADGAIRKVPLAGGPATVMADDVPAAPRGMDWGRSGLLVFNREGPELTLGSVWKVRAGSKPEVVTTLGEDEQGHFSPHLLPGDAVVVFTVRHRWWSWGDEEVVAQSLVSGKRTALLRNATDARYLPPGRLLFMRQGTLFAVPFAPESLEVMGEPVAIIDGIAQALTAENVVDITGAGQLAVSRTGDLAYIASPLARFGDSRIVTVDRSGRVHALPAPPRSYGPVSLSPDGRSLAVSIKSLTECGVWIYDLTRLTLAKLTPPGGEVIWERWTPDGQRLAFDWLQSGIHTLDWQPADGSAPPETLSRECTFPASWTPDGHELAVVKGRSIWVLDVAAGSGRLQPLAQSPASAGWPAFSPDGRWLLYSSYTSGRLEVYLQPYPGQGPRLQISVDGGFSPAWDRSGREIFFLGFGSAAGHMRMMSVGVSLGAEVKVGTPRQMFEFEYRELRFPNDSVTGYSVAPDGQRFFTTQAVKTDPPPPVTHINLILNWRAELEAKVPSGM